MKREEKTPPPSAHSAEPGNQPRTRTCWRLILTFGITEGMALLPPPHPKARQTSKQKPQNKRSIKNVRPADHTSSASHTPHCRNCHQSLFPFGSRSRAMWTAALLKAEQETLRRTRWLWVLPGVWGTTHFKSPSVTHQLKEGASTYVIAALTQVTHQHGISGKRQHKNHINVFSPRELAAWSLFAMQIFCP